MTVFHLGGEKHADRLRSASRFRLLISTTTVLAFVITIPPQLGGASQKVVGIRSPPPRALVTNSRAADAVYQQKGSWRRVVPAIDQHEEKNLAGSRTLGRYHVLRTQNVQRLTLLHRKFPQRLRPELSNKLSPPVATKTYLHPPLHSSTAAPSRRPPKLLCVQLALL